MQGPQCLIVLDGRTQESRGRNSMTACPFLPWPNAEDSGCIIPGRWNKAASTGRCCELSSRLMRVATAVNPILEGREFSCFLCIPLMQLLDFLVGRLSNFHALDPFIKCSDTDAEAMRNAIFSRAFAARCSIMDLPDV